MLPLAPSAPPAPTIWYNERAELSPTAPLAPPAPPVREQNIPEEPTDPIWNNYYSGPPLNLYDEDATRDTEPNFFVPTPPKETFTPSLDPVDDSR